MTTDFTELLPEGWVLKFSARRGIGAHGRTTELFVNGVQVADGFERSDRSDRLNTYRHDVLPFWNYIDASPEAVAMIDKHIDVVRAAVVAERLAAVQRARDGGAIEHGRTIAAVRRALGLTP